MKRLLMIVFLTGTALAVNAEKKDEYLISFGAAKTDITPPINTTLPSWKRESKSVAIHDRLYAQIIAVKDSKNKTVLFLRGDMMRLPVMVARYLRAYCKKKYNIPAENMLFSASHSHNAPYVMPKIIGEKAYKETLAKLCRAIDKAMLMPYKGYMKIGKSTSDLGVSRRWPNPKTKRVLFRPNVKGKIDNVLTVIRFCDLKGDLKAFIWIYGCHNTAYGKYIDGKSQISSEWSGEVDILLEKAFPGVIVAFMQGAAGDVKPRFISEKLSKGRPCWYSPSSAQMKDFALKYSKPIIKFIKEGDFKRVKVDFAASIGQFKLFSDMLDPRNIKNYRLKTKEELERLIKSDKTSAAAKKKYKYSLRVQWHVGGKRNRKWQGQVIRINPTTQILALSGEPTSGFAEILYKAFPKKNNIFIGYTLGDAYGDYLTNYKQVREGGYEPGGMYGPGMEKTIVDFYKKLIPR